MQFIKINNIYYNMKYIKKLLIDHHNEIYEFTFNDNTIISCSYEEFNIFDIDDVKKDCYNNK
jgi:hypothetical protein